MPDNQKTIWSKLGINKEEFDWIESYIDNNWEKEKTQADYIKELIVQLRSHILGEDVKTVKITPYEIRLFLLGKIFERILSDGTMNRIQRKHEMASSSMYDEDDDD